MARWWLVPVRSGTHIALGEERIQLDGETAEMLRSIYGSVHPRLLAFIKAGSLPADGSELDNDWCGIEDADIDLGQAGEIRFDGDPIHLSHCGEAFFDSLLSPKQVRELLQSAAAHMHEGSVWLPYHQMIVNWNIVGLQIVLIREDESNR